MMSKLLTISIAAYNVSNFLPKIFEEFAQCQQKDKLEVIIVNDGSTDEGKTLSVARYYESQFPTFTTVIDKINGGHGSTINAGMAVASGKYFRPLDGDDWLDHQALDALLCKLETCNADLVVCNHTNYYENNGTRIITPHFQFDADVEYLLNDKITDLKMMRYHDIYYKTEILQSNPIAITEHCFYTDIEYITYPLQYVKNVIRFDLAPYFYRIGVEGQSISYIGYQKHAAEHRRIFDNMLEFYCANKDAWSAGMRDYVCSLLGMLSGSHLYIFFTHKFSIQWQRKAIEFDNIVKRYPEIYRCCTRKAVKIWRKNRTALYFPVTVWVNIKEHVN